MTETEGYDYITAIAGELEVLEAELESVELVAEHAEREVRTGSCYRPG
jgi:hypothetical protein